MEATVSHMQTHGIVKVGRGQTRFEICKSAFESRWMMKFLQTFATSQAWVWFPYNNNTPHVIIVISHLLYQLFLQNISQWYSVPNVREKN